MFSMSNPGSIPDDVLLQFSSYLKPVHFFLMASVSRQWCTHSINSLRKLKDKHSSDAKQSYATLIKMATAFCCQEMGMRRGTDKEEKMRANRIKYFLHLGVDANHYSLIMTAAEKGHEQTLALLHERKANFHQSGAEVAHVAARSNQPSVIKFLSDNRYPLEKSSGYQGNTAVHTAVESHQNEAILAFGDAGVTFQVKNQGGLTPLELALDVEYLESFDRMQKRLKTFITLLNAGAYPNEGAQGFITAFEKKLDNRIFRSYINIFVGSFMGGPHDEFGGMREVRQEADYVNTVLSELAQLPEFKENTAHLLMGVKNALFAKELERNRMKKSMDALKSLNKKKDLK